MRQRKPTERAEHLVTRAVRPAPRIVAVAVAALAALSLTAAVGQASAGVRAGASRHSPHRQALLGSLRSAHVPMIRLVIVGGRGGPGDPGNDYPAALMNRPQDSVLDQWREFNRECTSFVAWALYSRNGFNMPFYDNANKWGPRARALGYVVNSTPAPGAVAWSNAGSFGHVAYVERVTGGSVYIEEYNERGNGTYDSRTVPASAFTGYIHFKDVPASPEPLAPTPGPEKRPVTVTPPTGAPSAPAGPASTPLPPMPVITYSEQETPNHPVNTFLNYHNAGGEGPAIGSGAWVQVSCKVYDPTILSVNPDGYWYRIATSPWNNAYYSPANTFMNGDPYGGPYTHNTDFSVPNC